MLSLCVEEIRVDSKNIIRLTKLGNKNKINY